MHDFNWRVVIEDRRQHLGKNLYIFSKTHDGKIQYMAGDLMHTVEVGAEFPPTLVIPDEELAQAIVEAFAQKGFKFEKGRIEGKLEATEKHLEDMRAIVFEKEVVVNIEAPKRP